MKKFLYLLLLVSSLSIAQSKEIIDDPSQSSTWFILDKTAFRFENNFILNNDRKPHAVHSNLSNKEYHFTIFGGKVNFKVATPRESCSGIIYIDSLKENKDKYKIENLEFQIVKNNTIATKWTLITQTKKYSDSYFYEGKEYFENYFLPYSDSLVNGDKLVILLRKKGQEPFLKLHLEKKESARKPFIIATKEDLMNVTSLESFIQESIESLHKDKSFDKTTFYNSWPEEYSSTTIGNRNRHFKNEKYCLFFRKPNGKKRTPNSFEYRISTNSKTAEWRNSNGIIFLDLNESGTEYKLEVRYKDDPKYISVYYYSTVPEWYQTLWFKITTGLLSLLTFTVIALFLMRKKSERNRLQQKSKLKMLYAQLNPHFIFNSLGSIQGLLNNNEIEKANQYLVGFGSLLRNTLTSSESETVSLEIEIKSINNYIELEQLRNPFLYHLAIDKTLDLHDIKTLPLLMQPLIENAIKHGISNKGNSEIKITISKKGYDLIFELTDNGKGFDILAEQKGLGLKLAKDRIALFNQSSKKMKINMKIESNSSGTQITIFYKNWLNND